LEALAVKTDLTLKSPMASEDTKIKQRSAENDPEHSQQSDVDKNSVASGFYSEAKPEPPLTTNIELDLW